ncbi:hypothetical protein JKF63_02612 [Porcisia hertigi]|uniref:PRP1 splicing factor N-terminal domain-containing protein n=1 Tax=Porcisia hertigi TaxID=2761500 RepID=A0A836L6C7_9TRYP|nr:hypothetical protein JKF63_02612 [Porcisia hertigi]
MDGKQDKYEQLLAKVDWHAPHPPKGYVYGVGRGAKGFVTTAELTTAVNTTAKMTRDESDFFSAMQRLEDRARRPRRGGEEAVSGSAGGRHSSGVHGSDVGSGGGAKGKLSLEDLATLEAAPAAPSARLINAAGSQRADSELALSEPSAMVNSSASVSASGPSVPLVVRSARTEEGEAAEEHVFAEERVLTAYDVLKGKASAIEAGLHNVLEMGSTEEQTTWITHARAYRQMGMSRRAYQTLVDGCAVTGKKGKRIWEERLRYLAKDNYSGRRRLLEEATSACPGEEDLWTQLLDCVPPLERVQCLQRAVLACPSSERLWLRLVHYVPSSQDQRALLQRALQYTPTLPLLWARLARLETYQRGKEMFQAAAARYPSLALIIEAAKYVEWHILAHHWADRFTAASTAFPHSKSGELQFSQGDTDGTAFAAALYAAVRKADTEVHGLVRTAQRNYLDFGEPGSRHAWLSLALSLLLNENVEGGDWAEVSNAEATTVVASRAWSAAPNVYVCTAAHMFLCVVDPDDKKGAANAIAATWLEDLVSLLPTDAASRHSVQCALCYSWLRLQQQLEFAENHSGDVKAMAVVGSGSSSSSAAAAAIPISTIATTREILPVVTSAVLSASAAVLHGALSVVLRCGTARGSRAEESPSFLSTACQSAVARRAVGAYSEGQGLAEEEEEEELVRPSLAPGAAVTTSAAVTTMVSSIASEPPLPPPLVVVLASLLGLSTRIITSAAGALGGASLALQCSGDPLKGASSAPGGANAGPQLRCSMELLLVEVPLAVADALYRRGCFAAALAVMDRHLHMILSTANDQTAGALRLYVARAKMLVAMGDCAAADVCLVSAIEAARGAAATVQNQQSEEEVWVKLAILRRSQGQSVDALVADALEQCRRSWRLWLIRLEEKRRVIQQRQDVLAPTSTAVSVVELLRKDESFASGVRELRVLSKKALSPDHCWTVAAVWVFVAIRVEAELLQNVAAARALLTDALSACAPDLQSTRSHVLARSVSPQELERQASAVARIGVAQAMLEAQYGTPGQALEVVHEVLQKLPKTREGTFAMAQDDALGELLGLFISLEPCASRGRAAAQVMRQWKSREPLALCAVAQLYFAAGQYARALDQAKKAVQLSKGRCGDAVGLLWRMAETPVMQSLVREALEGKRKEDSDGNAEGGRGIDAVADATSTGELTAEAIQQWVFSVMNTSGDAGACCSAISGASGELADKENPPAASAFGVDTPFSVVPNSGSLWVAVAEENDPSNVTLLGYRRSVAEMLREVADRIVLKGPAPANTVTRP